MVEGIQGLTYFRDYFAGLEDHYVLIGGVACALALDEAGASEPRLTKDLDIVLCAEAETTEFARRFWSFVKEGEYEHKGKSEGEKQFYRFEKPKSEEYPKELELFSTQVDSLEGEFQGPFIPIPIDADVESLSAILLDADYYQFLKKGITHKDGVPVVGPVHLVPLKARAWLDMTERKAKGSRIDSNKIKKHKLDVFRLYSIIDPAFEDEIPKQIRDDVAEFLERMKDEAIDFRNIGLGDMDINEALSELESMYCE